MNCENFKQAVISLVGDISFTGPRFCERIEQLDEKTLERLFLWLKQLSKPFNFESNYQGYSWHELLGFRFPLIIDSAKFRILLIKRKNGQFLELHIGDHKYYDAKRREFGVRDVSTRWTKGS